MKLSEKTCLITGANSGLGFAVAKRFAESGAKTILLCLLFSSLELSRRLEETGIEVIITDPGPFKSNLVREAS
ncbi:MAG: SDR family oxidoreductase [Calditrichales bacterium]|nr:MAG: SDR family oxidoreductase [Calditrichales bacterium]